MACLSEGRKYELTHIKIFCPPLHCSPCLFRNCCIYLSMSTSFKDISLSFLLHSSSSAGRAGYLLIRPRTKESRNSPSTSQSSPGERERETFSYLLLPPSYSRLIPLIAIPTTNVASLTYDAYALPALILRTYACSSSLLALYSHCVRNGYSPPSPPFFKKN